MQKSRWIIYYIIFVCVLHNKFIRIRWWNLVSFTSSINGNRSFLFNKKIRRSVKGQSTIMPLSVRPGIGPANSLFRWRTHVPASMGPCLSHIIYWHLAFLPVMERAFLWRAFAIAWKYEYMQDLYVRCVSPYFLILWSLITQLIIHEKISFNSYIFCFLEKIIKWQFESETFWNICIYFYPHRDKAVVRTTNDLKILIVLTEKKSNFTEKTLSLQKENAIQDRLCY